MQPNTPPDNVWISREEYDKLRAAAATTPQVTVSAPTMTMKPDKFWSFRAADILAVIMALCLLAAFTVGGATSILVIPCFIILTAIGVKAVVDASKKPQVVLTPAGYTGVPARKPMTAGRVLLIMVGCILLAPVVLYGSFFVFLIVLMALSGGQGGS